jgi:chloramphenicol-sensitive protein RarD
LAFPGRLIFDFAAGLGGSSFRPWIGPAQVCWPLWPRFSYAVVRKRAPLGALVGLTAETTLLAPFALAWLVVSSPSPQAAFGGSWPHAFLIAGTGLATALPLLFFGHATRTLRLTTLGILQFLGPTIQFFIGWKLYGEPMTGPRLLSFALIWLAIGIYAVDAGRKAPGI